MSLNCAGQEFPFGNAPNTSLAFSQGSVVLQDNVNDIQAIPSYPSANTPWGQSTGPIESTLFSEYPNSDVWVREGDAIGAASIYSGETLTSEAYFLDIFLNIFLQPSEGNSSIVECLRKSGQFTCTPIPLIFG